MSLILLCQKKEPDMGVIKGLLMKGVNPIYMNDAKCFQEKVAHKRWRFVLQSRWHLMIIIIINIEFSWLDDSIVD